MGMPSSAALGVRNALAALSTHPCANCAVRFRKRVKCREQNGLAVVQRAERGRQQMHECCRSHLASCSYPCLSSTPTCRAWRGVLRRVGFVPATSEPQVSLGLSAPRTNSTDGSPSAAAGRTTACRCVRGVGCSSCGGTNTRTIEPLFPAVRGSARPLACLRASCPCVVQLYLHQR